MLTWMLYVIVVSILLSAAAFVAERGARLSRMPSRWIWTVSIIASLLLPSVIASVSISLPNISATTTSGETQTNVPLREMTSTYLSPAIWIAPYTNASETWRQSDATVKRIWWSMSGVMLFALFSSGLHLYLRKRRWELNSLRGTQVYIAPNVGPAVVGLLRPRIVVPSWLTQSPLHQQDSVLAHELSHLRAGDQQLLTIALCLLVFMPWNLPLWWQLRRLRCAIEVDCDIRVVDGGHNVRDYGETLIEVGQRQSLFIGAVAAMSESKSFLQQRIEIMVYQPIKWWRIAATALACLSIGFAAVAAQVSPPNATPTTDSTAKRAAPANSQDRPTVAVDASVLDRYVGTYRLMGASLITVTREGDHLYAQLSGQQKLQIFASSDKEFFYKIVNAQITFEQNPAGATTGLVLHQNGQNMQAPRIDSAIAEQIKNAVAEKIRNQTASPGSDAAIRKLIASIDANAPNYDEMSPILAATIRQQLPMLHGMGEGMGPLLSIEFKGVGNQGWDVYDVKHVNGVAHWRVAMDDDGKMASALVLAADLPVASGP